MLKLKPPSPAFVLASVALFVALSGSAFAAVVVTSSMIKNNSITTNDIKNGTLLAKDFKRGQLLPGPAGVAGPAGAAGARGADGAAGPQGPDAATPTPATVGLATFDGVGSAPIQSLSVSINNPNGVATAAPITLTRAPDALSSKLQLITSSGEHVKTATVDIYRPGSTDVRSRYEFANVAFKTFSNTQATETDGFAVDRVAVTQFATDGTSTRSCYDYVANVKCQ